MQHNFERSTPNYANMDAGIEPEILLPPYDSIRFEERIYMDPMKVDVHNAKASHMSTPLTDDFQWHLNKQDYPGVKCKIGKDYMITVPMTCTSVDGESYRFVVQGKIQIHDVAKGLMDTFKKGNK